MNTIASIYQIQKVMLKESNEFTTICQIVYFLNINPVELLKSEITEEKVLQEQESHYIRNRAIADWGKFDKENVARFETFCKGIYDGLANDNGRPERVSERMVYKFLGVTSYGFRNMPECRAVYEKYTESYEESWARKVMWAYEKLKQEKWEGNIYWSDLRKLSGVKKESLNEISRYSHCDIISIIKSMKR